MIKKYVEKIAAIIQKNQLSGAIVGAVSCILILLFSLTQIYEIFELKLYDLRFKLKPSMPVWEYLTFVDIDENSINEIGLYPWPRTILAKGLDVMDRVGAAQVNFDILFPDESPNQLDNDDLKKLEAKSREGARISGKELQSLVKNNDALLAKSIQSISRVILTYEFRRKELTLDIAERQQTKEFLAARKRFLDLASVPIPAGREKEMKSLYNPTITGISYPIPPLMMAARSFGFSDRDTDVDGGFRKIRLVNAFEGRIFFNLALSMLMDICRVKPGNVDIVPGSKIVLRNAFNPVTQEIRDLTIPIDDKGMMYVNWTESRQRDYKRENAFNTIPFNTLFLYEKWADDIHKFFDEAGATGGSVTLAILNDTIGEATKRYHKAATPEERKKEWKVIADARKKIFAIKKGYRKLYAENIRQMEKEAAAKNDPALKKEVKIMKDDLVAMDQVIRVEALQDNVIITGLTATGTIDIGITPLNPEYPRVGIYHNTINTILQHRYITRTGHAVNWIIIVLIALAMGILVQRMTARKSLILIGCAFFGITIVIIMLFIIGEIWIEQMGISLAILVPSLTLTSIKLMSEESQKRFIKSAFSYYLSPTVIDEIIKDPDSLELGGEEREITIFFSDVKSFSTISEKLTPKELVVRLNEYLTEMTDIILKYNGTVDKYIGDAIMAFYGAPTLMPDHAVKACIAAIDMKKRLRELQEKWRGMKIEPIFARMGIHSGKATVGNMGSRTRMDYTAMGDAVNLASRLEGANKSFETSAMISGSTYEAAKDRIEARMLGKIRVVGKTEAVPIYELLGLKGALPDYMYGMLEKYNEGRGFFVKRDWKQAINSFKQAARLLPDDGPSRIYIEKCEEYMKAPPAKRWDGVFVLKQK